MMINELQELLNKKKKTMKRVELEQFLSNSKPKNEKLYCINIRGANGSGKSTFPIKMLLEDDESFMLTENGKDVVTVFPKFNILAIGRYYLKTGGCDASPYKEDKTYIKYMLDKLWLSSYNILFEGITVSSSYTYWVEVFNELEEKYKDYRQILIMNLVMPLEKLEERIKMRNGGKDINMKYVKGKLNTVIRNIKKFEDAGFNSWVTSTEGVLFEDLLPWFFNQVKQFIR